VGPESVDVNDRQPAPAEYCRDIEAYLCRKNDGHLIRVVGPSFEIVSRWAASGIPIKVAYAGIDRYFERYYRQGTRRRPVKIDFCDADVLDVFDEWRRSTLRAASASTRERKAHASLPAHLERVVTRLTSARASGRLSADADGILDRVSEELDVARATSGGVRGAARDAMRERLAVLDADLLAIARAGVMPDALAAIERDADQDLAPFADQMPADRYQTARDAAIAAQIRERAGLPVITFD